MLKRVEEAVAAVAVREGVDPSWVPGDTVTQSGGGFDPHISPRSADIHVQRVARARRMSAELVSPLVCRHTQSKQLGLLGQARANSLELNLTVDHLTTESRSVRPAGRR